MSAMAGLIADPEFRLNGVERSLLGVLNVPEAPSPPDGSPDSIRVFRAGRNYYLWSLIMWGLGALLAGGLVLGASLPLAVAIARGSEWARIAAGAVLLLLWMAYLTGAGVTLVSCRLNYGLRWYIVTDRSLRIRSGIFAMSELTMTYSNIQEIRVASGPLQQLLGIADVEVQAAGGGGDGKHGGSGHVGRFSGVAHATDIRDLIVDRLRQYRDSGLGEAMPVTTSPPASDLAAGKAVLDAARALRVALESGGQTRT
jgi:membrane protein YdbS with pleckstrin-like domain